MLPDHRRNNPLSQAVECVLKPHLTPDRLTVAATAPGDGVDQKPSEKSASDGKAFHVEVFFGGLSKQHRRLGRKLIVPVIKAEIYGNTW